MAVIPLSQTNKRNLTKNLFLGQRLRAVVSFAFFIVVPYSAFAQRLEEGLFDEAEWQQLDNSVERRLRWLTTQQNRDGSFATLEHGQPAVTKEAPKKQRHTATRIFHRLCDEHDYSGGYTSVRMAVRDWKLKTQEVFLPLSHPPGEAQVDFGYAYIDLAGERVQVALFLMTLPYSDAFFMQAFPRECTESFQEGHKRAFAFFGGVPARISYDNSKIAVTKITGSRQRQLTKEFLRLQSHYLYASHFCLVRRANEKGHVENLVGYGRRNFLVPIPQVHSIQELNEELERRCRTDLERTLRGKSLCKRALLQEERTAMLDLPRQTFDARKVTEAGANSLSLVPFDTNSYSVPVKYA